VANQTPTADAGAVPCPATGRPLYRTILQDEPPPWVRSGVRVKVKTTPSTRLRSRGSNGLPVRVPSYGDKNDSAAWAGEVGTVELDVVPHKTEAEVQAGGVYYGGTPYVAGEGGYYSYTVKFARGRTYTPRKPEDWGLLVRLPKAKTDTGADK
jgi:hypothetical protein